MDQRVQAAIAFMKTNLDRRYTSAEIARAVRLSPAHLRDLFKDETGTSLTRYRKELRLERAKHFLETTFLSIKEIAASVGLTSVGHFVTDFKKAYRMTPSECADRHRTSRETR